MTRARFIVATTLDGLASLDDTSVDLVITSPPYWEQVTYTDDQREMGHGALGTYVARITEVFSEVRRVLAPSGLVWLNVGDTAAGSGGSGGDYRPGGARSGRRAFRQGDPGVAPRQWCDVPWRLVHELQSDGWLLRSTVVWDKGRAKRESLGHARRPGQSWEPVFLLVPEAPNRQGLAYGWHPEHMTEPGNVWHIAPDHHPEHPAVFPAELVRRCIEPTEASVLLDPFCGTGTALAVAHGMGLSAVGIDLDPHNAELARERVGMFLEVAAGVSGMGACGASKDTQSKEVRRGAA